MTGSSSAFAFLGYVGYPSTVALSAGPHLRRKPRAWGRDCSSQSVPGGFVAGTGRPSSVVVLVAQRGGLFLAFPGSPRGGVAERPGSRSSMAGVLGCPWRWGANMGPGILPNPDVLLRVGIPRRDSHGPEGLYFRGRWSYDRFDGLRWNRSLESSRRHGPRWAGYRDGGRGGSDHISGSYSAAPGVRSPVRECHPNKPPPFAGLKRTDVVASSPGCSPPCDGSETSFLLGGGTSRHYRSTPLSGRLLGASDSPGQPPGRATPPPGASTSSCRRGPRPSGGGHWRTPGGRWWRTGNDRISGVLAWSSVRSSLIPPQAPALRPGIPSVEHLPYRDGSWACEYFATGTVVLAPSRWDPFPGGERISSGESGTTWGLLRHRKSGPCLGVRSGFPGLGWVPFDPTPPAMVGAAAGAGSL